MDFAPTSRLGRICARLHPSKFRINFLLFLNTRDHPVRPMSLRNFVAEDGKRANLTCIKPTAGGKFFVDDDSAPDFFQMLAASDWSRPRFHLSDNFAHTLDPEAVAIAAIDLDVLVELKEEAKEVAREDILVLVEHALKGVRVFTDQEHAALVFSRDPTPAPNSRLKFGVHIYLPDLLLDFAGYRDLAHSIRFFYLNIALPEFGSFSIVNKLDQVFDLGIHALRNICSSKPRGEPKVYTPFAVYSFDKNNIELNDTELQRLRRVCDRGSINERIELLRETALFLSRQDPQTPVREDRQEIIQGITNDEKAWAEAEPKRGERKGGEGNDDFGKFKILTGDEEGDSKLQYDAVCALVMQILNHRGFKWHRSFKVRRYGGKRATMFSVTFPPGHGFCLHKTLVGIKRSRDGDPMAYLRAISANDFEIAVHGRDVRRGNQSYMRIYPNRIVHGCLDDGCQGKTFLHHCFYLNDGLSNTLFGKTFTAPKITTTHSFGSARENRISAFAKMLLQQHEKELEAKGCDMNTCLRECLYDYNKD